MRKITILYIVVLFLVFMTAFAQEKQTVAIFDLQALGVSQYEAQSITNRIRHELFQTGQYTVLERESMEEILKEQGLQMTVCTTSECVIRAGKILGVQYMIAGSLDKLGNLYTINLRMIDVETGEVKATAKVDCMGMIEEVAVKSTGEAVGKLIVKTSSPEARIKLPVISHSLEKYPQNRFLPYRGMLLSKGKYFLNLDFNYRSFNRQYNWQNEEWEFVPYSKYSQIDYQILFDTGLSEKWEFSSEANISDPSNSAGQGNFVFQFRYAIYPDSRERTSLNMLFGVRFNAISNDNPSTEGRNDFKYGAFASKIISDKMRINGYLIVFQNGTAKELNYEKIGNTADYLCSLDYFISQKTILTSSLSYYQKERNEFGSYFSKRKRLFLHQDASFIISDKTYIMMGSKIFLWGKGGSKTDGIIYMELGWEI